MTTRFKDFGTGPKPKTEPISFRLHGEDFNCVQELQGSTLLHLVADSSGEDPAKAASLITDFFKSVLQDESYVRFEELINSKDKIVTVESLGEITGWLIQEYTDRPE